MDIHVKTLILRYKPIYFSLQTVKSFRNKLRFRFTFLILIFQQIRSVRPGIKQFKLSTVTSDLDRDRLDEMTIASVKRILQAESKAEPALVYKYYLLL